MIFEITSQIIGFISVLASILTAIAAYRSLTRSGGDTVTQAVLERLSNASPNLDSAEKQYLLLREYHAQGLAQSKTSFWFSLIFASLGFLVIITSTFTIEPNNLWC